MKISSKDFRVREGHEVNLRKWRTNVKPVYKSKEHYQKLLGEHVAQLSAQQELLYASNRYAVLLIFQAMDAAGKDGAIKHVMSGVNPQGCQVFSFKHPSPAELQHDFLWRTTRDLPERGRIGIFNRSYYCPESFKPRVQPFQLNAGVRCCELPVCLGVMLVAIVLPSGDFSGESLFVWNAAIQTLGRENAQFGLRHAEPTAVLRRVMPFEAFGEAARLVGRKGFIKRGGLVGAG